MSISNASSQPNKLFFQNWKYFLTNSPLEYNFLIPFFPILEDLHSKITSAYKINLHSKSSLLISEKCIAESIFNDMGSLIIKLIIRYCAIELRTFRKLHQNKVHTSEDIFNKYVEFFSKYSAPNFFNKFPVAKKILDGFITAYLSAQLELLEHCLKDFSEIKEHFFSEGRYILNKVARLGDPHCHCKTVSLLTFHKQDDQGIKNIIYKPRALKNEQAFSQAITWLNSKMDYDLFKPRFLSKTDYGWCEYIQGKPCQDHKEVKLYYKRFGALLTIMYAFFGTDIHYENLISEGSHPIIVDLESIFQPITPFLGKSPLNRNLILYTAMLPRLQNVSQFHNTLDISAFSGEGNQMHWRKAYTVQHAGTAHMCVSKKTIKIKPKKNIPSLKNEPVNPIDYADDLLKGFEEAYHLILIYKKELLEEDSFLNSFEGISVRLVYRNTSKYYNVIDSMFRPSLLRDERKLDLYMDTALFNDSLQPLIIHEKKALLRQDIPFFHCLSSGRRVMNDDNKDLSEKTLGCIVKTGFARVKEHFQKTFSVDDLKIQRHLIFQSLLSRQLNKNQAMPNLASSYCVNSHEVIQKLLSQLRETAIKDEQIFWTILKKANKNTWYISKTNLSFYNGLAGIGLLLASISNQLKNDFKEILVNIISLICQMIHSSVPKFIIDSPQELIGILCMLCLSYRLLGLETILNSINLLFNCIKLPQAFTSKNGLNYLISLIHCKELFPDVIGMHVLKKIEPILSKIKQIDLLKQTTRKQIEILWILQKVSIINSYLSAAFNWHPSFTPLHLLMAIDLENTHLAMANSAKQHLKSIFQEDLTSGFKFSEHHYSIQWQSKMELVSCIKTLGIVENAKLDFYFNRLIEDLVGSLRLLHGKQPWTLNPGLITGYCGVIYQLLRHKKPLFYPSLYFIQFPMYQTVREHKNSCFKTMDDGVKTNGLFSH